MKPAPADERPLPDLGPAPRLRPEARRAIGERLEAAAQARGRRRRWLRAGGVGLAAAAALALVLVRAWDPPVDAPAADRTTTTTRLRTGPGDFQLLPVGETGPDGSRAVAFVGEDSEVELPAQVSAGVAPPSLRLLRGSVRLIVRRHAGQPFVVATPAAEVVVLGTEFDVSLVDGATEVAVVRGEVEVRNQHGRRRLWAREAARAEPGEAPRMIVPVRGLVHEGTPEVAPGGP
jgi:ferric-dicitrate binding protein FerR (iron transport regulator)